MGLAMVKTGIDGLDTLLGGGIPKGSTLLVSGPPGAGKTVMSLQYAFGQAKKGERVLFVSTCELLYSINKFASTLSFFDLSLIRTGINLDYFGPKVEGGFVEFWDYSLGPILDEQTAGDIFDAIQDKVNMHRIDHLIVDSITSINMFMGDEVERRKKMLMFSGWASRSGCTTIFTAESDGIAESTERFLSDGVVDLKRAYLPGNSVTGSACRTIEVVKLRGQRHLSGSYLYTLSGTGFNVMTPGIGSQPENAASTGIEGLDSNIAGMAYGSSWLFNVRDASAYKPLLDEMMMEAARSGDGLVYVASAGEDLSEGSLKERLGDAESLKGHISIVDVFEPGDRQKDAVAGSAPDDLLKVLRSRACARGKKCRVFMNVGELCERLGTASAKALYKSALERVRSQNGILVTFNGSLAGESMIRDVEISSDGIVDIWNAGGYIMLQVKKAPYAQNFEPFILNIKEGRIHLTTL